MLPIDKLPSTTIPFQKLLFFHKDHLFLYNSIFFYKMPLSLISFFLSASSSSHLPNRTSFSSPSLFLLSVPLNPHLLDNVSLSPHLLYSVSLSLISFLLSASLSPYLSDSALLNPISFLVECVFEPSSSR
jgi:hypothetical protein